MSLVWNDGALVYGAMKLDVYPMDGGTGGSGTGSTWGGAKKATYITEAIHVNLSSKDTEQMDETGKPAGGFGVEGLKTGNTVIQIASDATVAVVSDAFTIKLDNTVAESFVITSVSQDREQLTARKQSISFRKLYKATGPTLTA